MTTLPTVEAKEFEVAGLEWNAIGIPNLGFVLTYTGFSVSASCRYEAYDGAALVASGTLAGLPRGRPTQETIIFPPGVRKVTTLKLFAD